MNKCEVSCFQFWCRSVYGVLVHSVQIFLPSWVLTPRKRVLAPTCQSNQTSYLWFITIGKTSSSSIKITFKLLSLKRTKERKMSTNLIFSENFRNYPDIFLFSDNKLHFEPICKGSSSKKSFCWRIKVDSSKISAKWSHFCTKMWKNHF